MVAFQLIVHVMSNNDRYYATAGFSSCFRPIVFSLPWPSTSLMTNNHSLLITTVSPTTGAIFKLSLIYSATACSHILFVFRVSSRDSNFILSVKKGTSLSLTLGDSIQSP